jgi:hypothetical protein
MVKRTATNSSGAGWRISSGGRDIEMAEARKLQLPNSSAALTSAALSQSKSQPLAG